MINHILFPYDGSEASRKAFEYLKDMAKEYEAKVTLLHTYEFTMGHVLSRYQTDSAYIVGIENKYQEFGDKLLGELSDELTAEGIAISKVMAVKGDAGHTIVKVAEQEKCDLIMIGNRGMGTMKNMFLGSTSRYVVDHSKKIPVFLIPVED